MNPEVWLAIGYCGFLLLAAGALSVLGRRGSRRAAGTPESGPIWPHAEAARFRQGLSLVLLLLAGFILGAMTVRHYGAREMLPLGGALLLWSLTAVFTWLRR